MGNIEKLVELAETVLAEAPVQAELDTNPKLMGFYEEVANVVNAYEDLSRPKTVVLQANDGTVWDVLTVNNYDKKFIPVLNEIIFHWNSSTDEFMDYVHARLQDYGYQIMPHDYVAEQVHL